MLVLGGRSEFQRQVQPGAGQQTVEAVLAIKRDPVAVAERGESRASP
jgi:hypothetical protein